MTTQIKVSLGWYERIWTLLEVYEMIDTNFILQTTLLLTCAKRWSCFEVIVHDSRINIQSQNNLSRYTYHLRSLHFETDLWCCNNKTGRFLLYFNYILKIIYSQWRDLQKCLRLLFSFDIKQNIVWGKIVIFFVRKYTPWFQTNLYFSPMRQYWKT